MPTLNLICTGTCANIQTASMRTIIPLKVAWLSASRRRISFFPNSFACWMPPLLSHEAQAPGRLSKLQRHLYEASTIGLLELCPLCKISDWWCGSQRQLSRWYHWSGGCKRWREEPMVRCGRLITGGNGRWALLRLRTETLTMNVKSLKKDLHSFSSHVNSKKHF